jgi:hypothetical protein
MIFAMFCMSLSMVGNGEQNTALDVQGSAFLNVDLPRFGADMMILHSRKSDGIVQACSRLTRVAMAAHEIHLHGVCVELKDPAVSPGRSCENSSPSAVLPSAGDPSLLERQVEVSGKVVHCDA